MIIPGSRRFVRAGGLAAALAALAGLGAAGCSASSGTGAARTLTPLPSASAPSTTASATAGTPAVTTAAPAAAHAGPPPRTAFTKQGAEQFARAYYLTASRALQMGHPGPVPAYLLRGCSCDNVVPLLRQISGAGRHFEGPGYRVIALTVENLAANTALVRVTFSLPQMRLVDQSGHRVDVSQAVRRQTNRLLLSYGGKRWHIARMLIGQPQ